MGNNDWAAQKSKRKAKKNTSKGKGDLLSQFLASLDKLVSRFEKKLKKVK